MEPLDLEGLKAHPELTDQVDWEITPRQAFEAFQLKSAENWKNRGLGEVLYFYLSTWRGENRVHLVKRTYVHSEDVAVFDGPADLVAACAARHQGQEMPKGQAPLDGELRDWLRGELGA